MNVNTILVNMPKEPFEAAAYRPSSEKERLEEQIERNRKRLFDWQIRKSLRTLRLGRGRPKRPSVHPIYAS